MAETIERQIIQLIATDRIDKPISSMSGKLKRAKPKLAKEIDLNPYEGLFEGERVYARIERHDEMKARGMREGIEAFAEAYPKYGAILESMIEEERALTETHIYFGVNNGCRLASDDYMHVMTNLGFTETTSRGLYKELIEVSYRIARARGETERSVLIG